ncbi:hypothetical protein MYSTI_06979 [Myxococcus stipitatus DSM 14675]|uniref:Lipoprotein n=1 Tax=Myxococcus stipitatus (strain DSM 14675 / JCM 12634 / Mx s8) TaxID=1278073 RepID=L7UGZ4_MYXSD|nr:hypothetical protein [Myxococcus stipitatus]AGC48251.1 hypothetical protein MYSTI_06979 [Myxococcus stipitatus DSM 14675]
MATLRNLGLTLVLAVSGLLSACSDPDGALPGWEEPPPNPSRQDSDGDGVLNATDCAPNDPARWLASPAFEDKDGDGWGFGVAQYSCTANIPSQGWAARTGDCDDSDKTRWRVVKDLYPDQDGDGATGQQLVEGCVGDTLVGYREQPGPFDCDDQDARSQGGYSTWPDSDGDGYGAGTMRTVCTGKPVPTGYASRDGDCDPANPIRALKRYIPYRDIDLDGITVPAPTSLCLGDNEPLPLGFSLVSTGEDCDDRDSMKRLIRDVYVDLDGDGFGAGSPEKQCTGLQPVQGKAFQGEDCAADDRTRWQWHSYAYRDADGDGDTVPENGVVCGGASLPPGHAVSPRGLDCDDKNPAVRLSWMVYVDEDADGVGAGAVSTKCAGVTVPSGYATTSTDCAPSDASAWKMLTYAHRDADGDNFTVPQTGELCTGGTLPQGYFASARNPDCDDSNTQLHTLLTSWADADGDGVGAGEAAQVCTNGQVPPPLSAVGTDCAANDATAWQQLAYAHVDRDADGATAPEKGSVCAGTTLLAPYFTKASGNDCDETDPARTRWVVLYPDHDGDGVGAEPRQVTCLGTTIPSGWSVYGYDTNDNDPGTTADEESDLELELLLSI